MKLIEGKYALVTGGGRGIGKAVALEFAKNGANIAIVARTQDELEETLKEIQHHNVKVVVISVDLSSIEGVKTCVNEYFKNFDRCDILVNNAGMAHYSTVIDYPLETAEKLFNLNVISYYALVQIILPKMIKQGGGNIIFTSSPQGTIYFSSNKVAYSASKAAVMAMGLCLQAEVGRHNIRVNVVLPGAIDTKMMKDLITAGQHFPEKISPEVIAPLYLFLASELSERKYKGAVVNQLMLNEIIGYIRKATGTKIYETKELLSLMKEKLNKEYFTFLRKNQELVEFMLNYKN
jgi:3-oxoacyl-[acyl-carrier protein] reductase